MKLKYISLIILVSISSTLLVAQNPEKYTFELAHEAELFEKLFKADDSISYVRLFSAIDENYAHHETYEARIQAICDAYDINEFTGKKRFKLVKELYDDVHKAFLNKYMDENHFGDIFEYGNYNCVSASALYAIIFECVGIPYTIKESPTHVYLLAYPDEEQIVIETTTPAFGYIEMKDEFKREYIDYLVENKIISEAELRNKGLNQLFNEYYFEESNINLDQLVGIQYANDAIYKSNAEKHQEAFEQIQKASFFYPSEKNDYMEFVFGLLWLEEGKSAESKIKTLSVIYPSNQSMFNSDNIVYEYRKMINEILTEKGNTRKIDSLHRYYTDIFSINNELSMDIDFEYLTERARLLYNQGNHIESNVYLTKALAINADHQDVKSMFSRNLVYEIHNAGYPLLEEIDSLESASVRYPFLWEIELYRGLLCENYLFEAYNNFDVNKASSGLEWLEKFESSFTDNTLVLLDKELISITYIEASKYYFRIRDMDKSKKMTEKALVFNPNSAEAKDRMAKYF